MEVNQGAMCRVRMRSVASCGEMRRGEASDDVWPRDDGVCVRVVDGICECRRGEATR